MELEQRLEKILLERYGIKRDDIDEALQKEQGVDLGIFVMPLRQQEAAV